MRDALNDAVKHALKVRGTVMLEADRDRWCAVRSSVQGDLELRVSVPRRGARARRLMDRHDFDPDDDYWTRPLERGEDPVAVLAPALVDCFGLEPDSRLERTLVHPGFVGWSPPPADASHAEHLEHAFTGLEGRAHIELGFPAWPLAWVHADAGRLLVKVQSARDPNGAEELGRYAAPREAADALVARVHRDFDHGDHDRLFISLLDVARP